MGELRKCQIKREFLDPLTGVFHQWGSKIGYGEGDQPFQVTYGVVELDSGEVKEVAPASIVFLDK